MLRMTIPEVHAQRYIEILKLKLSYYTLTDIFNILLHAIVRPKIQF